ncbi:uncharacterized protein METZ01_LOCUS471740, partial [marine metagenome]
MKIIQVNEVKFTETYIEGLFIITPEIFHDNRGYFFESFNNKNFNQNINNIQFCQDNESKSSKNTLRGLHFQIPPFDQTKLVRVVKGSILDVVVDLRKNSSTFGKYYSIKLNDKNKNQLLIPKGFAHGFLTLSDECVVNYKVDNPYSKDHEK